MNAGEPWVIADLHKGRNVKDLIYMGPEKEWIAAAIADGMNLAHERSGADEIFAALKAISVHIGGWRELIAMLDDMPKNEVVGKAMWAALNQIDDLGEQARTALAKAEGEE